MTTNGNGNWRTAAIAALGALVLAMLTFLATENRAWRHATEERMDALEREVAVIKAQR